MSVAGLAARAALPACADSLPLLPLLSSPPADAWTHAAAPLALAAAVTAARQALRAVWPDFREAGDTSGKQLRSLSSADVLLVSAAAALGEELLFRDALLPAISPDWRGALVAGTVFGALHVSGGRNVAYAAWATAVGTSYGMLALTLHDGWAPILAHALANAAGGLLWQEGDSRPADEASRPTD